MPTKRVPRLLLDWFCNYAIKAKADGGGIGFDGSQNFRYEVYADYKANRGAGAGGSSSMVNEGPLAGMTIKDAVYESLGPTKELFRSLGLFVSHQKRFEADDFMRSGAWKLSSTPTAKHKTVLVSPDKDVLQAVNERVVVFVPEVGKIPERWIREEDVRKKKHGLSPAQFLDLQILQGDGVDDIPAVPGCTKSEALSILRKHGSLTAFFKTEEGRKFYGSRATELHRNKELVTLSKRAFPYRVESLMFSNMTGSFDSQPFTTLKGLQSKRGLF